jgi:acyl dehydratase
MNKFDPLAVQIGDELQVLTREPITRATLCYFCGASNDHNPIHIDIDFAHAAGNDDVFAHGMLGMAYLGQLLTNWVPQEAIISFEAKFAAIVHVGDEITCRGMVCEKITTESGSEIKLKLTATDQHGDVKLTGGAVIRLDSAS